MNAFPLYFLLLACASFLLLGVSMASATAQHLRSKGAFAPVLAVRRAAIR